MLTALSHGTEPKKRLLSVGCGQQLRGGNEALNTYMKPNFIRLVKQKNNLLANFNFSLASGSVGPDVGQA
jgi:hypothetical protein